MINERGCFRNVSTLKYVFKPLLVLLDLCSLIVKIFDGFQTIRHRCLRYRPPEVECLLSNLPNKESKQPADCELLQTGRGCRASSREKHWGELYATCVQTCTFRARKVPSFAAAQSYTCNLQRCSELAKATRMAPKALPRAQAKNWQEYLNQVTEVVTAYGKVSRKILGQTEHMPAPLRCLVLLLLESARKCLNITYNYNLH